VQSTLQTLLLADAEEVDLNSLRGYVKQAIFKTFGDSISNELWKPVQGTIEVHLNSSVVDNMYRYKGKECSEPLDLVYSILSISTDGTGVSVEYGISKTQLARKVLSLLGHALCVLSVFKVLKSLDIQSCEEYFTANPFVNIQARILTNSLTCEECSQAIWFQDLPDFIPSGTYIHCLSCKRDNNKTGVSLKSSEHLLLYDLNSLGMSFKPRWELYTVAAAIKHYSTIRRNQEITIVNLDETSATIQFSLEDLFLLIKEHYECETKNHSHNQEVDEDAHVGTGWSLAV
jgi:hypothetical protein